MSEKKLSELELEEVNGGLTDTAGIHLHKPVDKYDVGNYQYLYFARKTSTAYTLYARVIRSYEDSRLCGTSERMHEVEIIDKTRYVNESGIEILDSLQWSAYEECWFQD